MGIETSISSTAEQQDASRRSSKATKLLFVCISGGRGEDPVETRLEMVSAGWKSHVIGERAIYPYIARRSRFRSQEAFLYSYIEHEEMISTSRLATHYPQREILHQYQGSCRTDPAMTNAS